MSWAFDGEEIRRLKMRAVSSETAQEYRNDREKAQIVKFDKNVFSAVEFKPDVDEIYELLHSLQSTNSEHREGYKSNISTHGFE